MAKQSNWQRYSASGTKALQSRDLDTAESMWLAAMEEATDFTDTDPRLAHTLESLAEVYYRRGNLDMASRYCQRVLDVCEKTLGPEHPDIGVLAHNLAMLHHMQCRFMEAEPLYKKAMTVRTKALGSKHPEVMRLLEGYADLLEKMHRGEEARHLKQCIDGMSTGRWTRSGRWTIFSSSGGAPGAPVAADAAALSARAQAEPNADLSHSSNSAMAH
ncbi:MAG: tetratricopeptide repeat protein, partial [Terriglobales bacterium]